MTKNIARYLNLPEYIIDMYDDLCYDMINYEYYVMMYESNDDIITISKNVSYLVNEINKISYTSTNYITKNFMIFIFLYYYIDKSFYVLKKDDKIERFRQVINEKLDEIKETYLDYSIIYTDVPLYSIFYNYINQTFEKGKRFLVIEHNKIYRKKILKNYILSIVRFNTLYQYTIEKRYAPNGSGYLEAKKNFMTSLT